MDILSRAHGSKLSGEVSPYGYTPELAAGVAYVVCFGFLTALHLGLAIKYKYWIALVSLVPGGVLEVIGWAGRLWSHFSTFNINPFIMQICCLILGPAFFSAWAYTILGYCITRLGSAYSLLKPKMYLALFVTADVISLVLQAIGGGGAAVNAKRGTSTTKSTKIMLAGILAQLGSMTIFTVLAVDFIVRVIARRPWHHLAGRRAAGTLDTQRRFASATPESKGTAGDGEGEGDVENGESVVGPANAALAPYEHLRKVEYLLAGVAFASLMIYVRGIYRSIELAQGWSGYLIEHEPYFIYLDGLPMILCLAGFAVAYPGWLLPQRQSWKEA